MKKIYFIIAVIAVFASASCERKVLEPSGELNGHQWVDLGLPSGTKWATCNVGASSEISAGDFFAWGELASKATYSLDTYNYPKCVKTRDGFMLDTVSDVAYVKWGEKWCIPTNEDWEELEKECIWEWNEKTPGYTVNSKVCDASIFLPASGYKFDSKLFDSESGYYWTSTYSTEESIDENNKAWGVLLRSQGVYQYDYACHSGHLIRPVLKQ